MYNFERIKETAYHEAGHFIMSRILNSEYFNRTETEEITIIQKKNILGSVKHSLLNFEDVQYYQELFESGYDPDLEEELDFEDLTYHFDIIEGAIRLALAGVAGEIIFHEENLGQVFTEDQLKFCLNEWLSGTDRIMAIAYYEIIGRQIDSKDLDQLFDMFNRTISELRLYKDWLDRISTRLLANKTLKKEQLKKLDEAVDYCIEVTKARRIYYKRKEGLPPYTKLITKSGKYGNPFSVLKYGNEESLILYRIYLEDKIIENPCFLEPLVGFNLACNCKEDDSCYVDILLEIIKKLYRDNPQTPLIIERNNKVYDNAS